MSELGHSLHFGSVSMSGLPPTTAEWRTFENGQNVPFPDPAVQQNESLIRCLCRRGRLEKFDLEITHSQACPQQRHSG